MLGLSNVRPTIPVVDADRAKKFYTEVLGLRVIEETEEGIIIDGGDGTRLLLYARGATKADHTVASFEVDDLEATMDDLRSEGVTFEDYDFPGLKTENGIAEMGSRRASWFFDTEGNIMAVGDIH